MNDKRKDPMWIWFLGCGGLIVAITISLLIITLVASKQGYQITHYPGAVFVSRDMDYRGLPYAIGQTEVYVTSDAGWDVYNWYAPYCETASCAYKDWDDYSLTIEKSQFYGHSKLSIALQEIPFGSKIYVSRFLLLPKWP